MLQSSQLEGRRCIVHQKGLWVSDRPAWRTMYQSINQSIILFSNAGYIKAAVRLMWTYNELIKCETRGYQAISDPDGIKIVC